MPRELTPKELAVEEYNEVVAILREYYCGRPDHNEQGEWEARVKQGKWRRNHVYAVANAVNFPRNNPSYAENMETVDFLLSCLKIKLTEAGKEIKPKGALAQCIQKIITKWPTEAQKWSLDVTYINKEIRAKKDLEKKDAKTFDMSKLKKLFNFFNKKDNKPLPVITFEEEFCNSEQILTECKIICNAIYAGQTKISKSKPENFDHIQTVDDLKEFIKSNPKSIMVEAVRIYMDSKAHTESFKIPLVNDRKNFIFKEIHKYSMSLSIFSRTYNHKHEIEVTGGARSRLIREELDKENYWGHGQILK